MSKRRTVDDGELMQEERKKEPIDLTDIAVHRVVVLPLPNPKGTQDIQKDIKNKDKIIKTYLQQMFESKQLLQPVSPIDCRSAVKFIRSVNGEKPTNQCIRKALKKYITQHIRAICDTVSSSPKHKGGTEEEMLANITVETEKVLSMVVNKYFESRRKTQLAEFAFAINTDPVSRRIIEFGQRELTDVQRKMMNGPRLVDTSFVQLIFEPKEDFVTEQKDKKDIAAVTYGMIFKTEPALPARVMKPLFAYDVSKLSDVVNSVAFKREILGIITLMQNSINDIYTSQLPVYLMGSIITSITLTRYDFLVKIITRLKDMPLAQIIQEEDKFFQYDPEHIDSDQGLALGSPLLEEVIGVIFKNAHKDQSGLVSEPIADDLDFQDDGESQLALKNILASFRDSDNLNIQSIVRDTNCQYFYKALLVLLNYSTQLFYSLLMPTTKKGRKNGRSLKRKIIYLRFISKADKKLINNIFCINKEPDYGILATTSLEMYILSTVLHRERTKSIYESISDMIDSNRLIKYLTKYVIVPDSPDHTKRDVFYYIIQYLFRTACKANSETTLVNKLTQAVQSILYEAISIKATLETFQVKTRTHSDVDDIVVFNDGETTYSTISFAVPPLTQCKRLENVIERLEQMFRENASNSADIFAPINLYTILERITGLQNDELSDWKAGLQYHNGQKTTYDTNVPFGVLLVGALESLILREYDKLDILNSFRRLENKEISSAEYLEGIKLSDALVELLRFSRYISNRSTFVDLHQQSCITRLTSVLSLINSLKKDESESALTLVRSVIKLESLVVQIISNSFNATDADMFTRMLKALEDTSYLKQEDYKFELMPKLFGTTFISQNTSREIESPTELLPSKIHLFLNKERTGAVIITEELLNRIQWMFLDESDEEKLHAVCCMLEQYDPDKKALRPFNEVLSSTPRALFRDDVQGVVIFHHLLFKTAPQKNTEDMMPNLSITEPVVHLRKFKRHNLDKVVMYLVKGKPYKVPDLLAALNNDLYSLGFENNVTMDELKLTVEELIGKNHLVRRKEYVEMLD